MLTTDEIVKAEPRLAEFFNLDIKKLPQPLRQKVKYVTSRILGKCLFQAIPDSTLASAVRSYVETAEALVAESKEEAL